MTIMYTLQKKYTIIITWSYHLWPTKSWAICWGC